MDELIDPFDFAVGRTTTVEHLIQSIRSISFGRSPSQTEPKKQISYFKTKQNILSLVIFSFFNM